ncbi:hypothetical protein RASY3_06690 [Ruminococcus albus SY3]|uniref:Uncharacterized protein n=2 Tax=Ruminococcus albus TaxID=1264 RepID=A0A011WT08_RUMAL|nr:hypothetical protein RASY3_06690 [Ruminococcus albus SY3]
MLHFVKDRKKFKHKQPRASNQNACGCIFRPAENVGNGSYNFFSKTYKGTYKRPCGSGSITVK